MWFKSAQIFLLDQPFPYNAEHFAERLKQRVARPCPKSQPYAYGWSSPYGNHFDELVHESNQCMLFTNTKEERILPSSVIKEVLDEKLKVMEEKEQREIYAKERSRLKDDITFSMLPQAFTKKTHTHAFIDNEHHWLLIDVSSRSKAETFTELLRNTLGSFKITPLQTQTTASVAMSHWLLSSKAPTGFEFGGDCEMRDKEKDRGAIRFYQLLITDKEVTNHLKLNRRLVKLELVWQKRIAFVLNDDCSISRIRFLDVVKESLEELDMADSMQKFESEFAMMSLELRHCIAELLDAMGGIIGKVALSEVSA
ncbi:MAG: hypothetical protein A3F17_05900 [Gammaproteobacteria bacterium RIFCSPHIGHO2_12_FULL_41_15]|nr:MAG: hypothetical protein A3F17_05900 [Gammaproteobacteria bacterium RIFCSPHIGHO2_12_FULL_41_15]